MPSQACGGDVGGPARKGGVSSDGAGRRSCLVMAGFHVRRGISKSIKPKRDGDTCLEIDLLNIEDRRGNVRDAVCVTCTEMILNVVGCNFAGCS